MQRKRCSLLFTTVLIIICLLTNFNYILADSENWRGSISLVSVSSDEIQANTSSSDLDISADGRFVTFSSFANNLIEFDTNNTSDIFLRDRYKGKTTVVSVNNDGELGNMPSVYTSISNYGEYVAFVSVSTNLVPNDNNNVADVFVHDTTNSTTKLISVSSEGIQGNKVSTLPSISGDGRFIAFVSDSDNLIKGDTNQRQDVFLYDVTTKETTLVSKSTTGIIGNSTSSDISISGNGRYVAFDSNSTNFFEFDSNNQPDVFVHDVHTGQTILISKSGQGIPGNNSSERPSISEDGRYVVFYSNATNLVENDINNHFDVFVHDRDVNNNGIFDEPGHFANYLVSISSSGIQGSADSHNSSNHAISADGRFVTFFSSASNLVFPDTNLCDVTRNCQDVFVHDLYLHETYRISDTWDGNQGDGDSSGQSISDDGKSVAFASGAQNLSIEDNNSLFDVFISGFPYVSINNGFINVLENSQYAYLTITLETTPKYTVTVDYKTEELNALQYLDFHPIEGTLEYSPGERSKTLLVPIVDDLLPELAQKSFLFNLFDPIGGKLGEIFSSVILISDDDLIYYYFPSISK